MQRLIDELMSGKWKQFRAAVAFVRTSGNNAVLLDSLRAFGSEPGNILELTFGADLFGGSSPASEYAAVERLLSSIGDLPGARVHLYHEPGRTFHPKMYLFSDEEAGRALVFIGSSNWSVGGMVGNVEANVAVELEFGKSGNREMYEECLSYFMKYWSENA